MLRTILICILSIGIIGVGYWGYQEHKEKTAVLLQAENNYQRAFHDLTYDMSLLNDKMGSTLAMSSRDQLSPALTEVWRVTSEAHSNVGQLPLTLVPFNKTEEFLSNVSDFSYRVGVRDLDKNPLTDEEYGRLEELYKQSTDIQQDLRKVQNLVLEDNLRWMDVEMALATNDAQADNTIIDGLKTVEKRAGEYSETDFGPTNASSEEGNKNFSKLKGKEIDENEARKVARSFLELDKNAKIDVTKNGNGANYKFYSLRIQEPGKEQETNMDITKKGGYPIWAIRHVDVDKQNISLNKAMNKAMKFLKDQRFESLVASDSAQYDNVGVFTFVEERQGVRIYPDAVKIKVSLGDGSIVGFSAADFLAAHHDREIPKPALNADEAKKKINENVLIQEERLAIIQNDLGEEVLCYEFLGTINKDTYRIFINAENGNEEDVKKMDNTEPIYNGV
ncbi:germination protein YpeB [Priestia filamentosa]|uniref:Germination protein YpeB n=1 Tax=Priestia filamentosa TaxID=1402861 RepID=A0A1X7D2N4_9BACI|nr:germination protein YpeB [Priestia filamentosa]AKO93983.1 germination protein YpeB [Priestia filamentosa]MDT3764232.1 germination protein YpeB [Priestia filamentosa]OXS71300.1 germination protein YpeB [Priestia filamentosa]RJS66941.1 germination protein YpeB [Priestia filamentosa]WCM14860.1 germination protein YpeB [Priestia filamentosa]